MLPWTSSGGPWLRAAVAAAEALRRRRGDAGDGRGRREREREADQGRFHLPFPSASRISPRLQRQLGRELFELRRVLLRVHAALQQLQRLRSGAQSAARSSVERAHFLVRRQRLLAHRADGSAPPPTGRPSPGGRAPCCPACRRCRRAARARSAAVPRARTTRRPPSSRSRTPRGSRPCRRGRRRPPRWRTRRRTVRRRASRTSRRRCASRSTMTRPGPGQRLDERPARARRVHEHHALRLQLREQRREVLRRHVGPGQVELRHLRRERAVPEEHDHHRVLLAGLRRHRRRAPSSPPSFVAAASASSVTFSFGDAELLRRRLGQRRAPLLEQLAVLRRPGEPDDDRAGACRLRERRRRA